MAEMSLERAVQVMNSNKHRDLDSWKLFRRSEAEVEVYSPENQYWWFSPHEAVAIAERYTHLAAPPAEKDGVALIAEERARQLNGEGYTEEHNDQHTNGELAVAAAAYLTGEPKYRPSICGYKPKGRTRDLVRAGALIAAEIDRISRIGDASSLDRPLPADAAPPAERAGGRPEAGQLSGDSGQLGDAVDRLISNLEASTSYEGPELAEDVRAARQDLLVLLAAAERGARAEAGPAVLELVSDLLSEWPRDKDGSCDDGQWFLAKVDADVLSAAVIECGMEATAGLPPEDSEGPPPRTGVGEGRLLGADDREPPR